MNSFFNFLSQFDFYIETKENMKSIQERYKELNRYIKVNVLKKNELVNLILTLREYMRNKNNEYKEFKFGKSIVKVDDHQHKIIVNDPYNNARIIACAGSGKTTTILCRIKYLLENYTTPERIVILTFNKDACENLKNRIADLFGFSFKIEIKTIDAFCAKIYYDYGTKKYNELSVSEYTTYALETLESDNGKKICDTYDFLFFDEFQDIDNIQFKILQKFYENGCYLTVIGDDNQNIYQFRGSNNHYMINFDNIFQNTITFPIYTNYRCSEKIVKLANSSISNNKNQIKKDMLPYNKEGENIQVKPELIMYGKKKTQFNFIINTINNLTEKNKYEYHDFAILSRNKQYLKIFEEALSKYNKETNNVIDYIADMSDDLHSNTKLIKVAEKITLSTIHKSKGLEWNVVFIIGMSDEYFPSSMNNSLENIDEERRLFYVAVTRAKHRLYFPVNSTEIPLSRFFGEISNELKYINRVDNPDYDNIKDVIGSYNEDKTRTYYSVSDLIKMLKPNNFLDLRKMNLLCDNEREEIILFNEELEFNNHITQNNFESDFGEFCDRLITHKINNSNNIVTLDSYAEEILNTIYLSKDEMELLKKYKIERLLNICDSVIQVKKKIINLDMNDNDSINSLLHKIGKSNNMFKLKFQRIYTYPEEFLKELRESYGRYKDINNKSDDIINDIYNISLCGHFCDNRRRLVYRNILNIFLKDFESIKSRIDDYVKTLKDNNSDKVKCKISKYEEWIDNDKKYCISGELDMVTDNSIIDFKFSTKDFQIEWYIQLLLYYSLLKSNSRDINIEYLIIVNLMKGKIYKMKIGDYNYVYLLNYFQKLIEKQTKTNNNDNDSIDISSLIVDNIVKKEAKKNIIKKEISHNINAENYLILDTEATGYNIYVEDIIQLTYQIYDKYHRLIKTVNEYVIPEYRVISNFITGLTGINDNIIKEKGIHFKDIIDLLVKDLYDVKYVIGHNIEFDLKLIENNLCKYNSEYVNIFQNKILRCTQKLGKDICNLKNTRGFIKNPKLEELYFFLFNKKFENAHNALNDVIACYECFFIIELREKIKKRLEENEKRKKLFLKIKKKLSNNN